MKNIFIIGTPIQLLNSIEAVKHFNLKNNILVIVYRSLAANKSQMKDIIDLYEWEEVIEIEYSSNSSLLRYVELIKYLKKYTYKYVFISKLEVIPKLVMPNVKKEKVFLLDDGTMTILIYEHNIKTKQLNKYNFRELRFLLFGLKVKIRDKINLFTYFDLEPVHGIEVVKNNLLFLKDKIKDAQKDDGIIYFLGQPISNLIDDELYRSSLEGIIKKYNKKLIYIPHRGETKEKLDYLSEIDNALFIIKNVDMPIELFFLNNNIYPQHVLSYYSTAVTTLNLIYENSIINYIKIPENSKNKLKFDSYLRRYYEIFDDDKTLELQDLGL